MARRAVVGYAEKSYYENVRFNGITAVTDELNEGSFKHLVNFDIADTQKSLTPRKGFLTTSLSTPLSESTIYFLDPKTGKYIFIDFANAVYTYEDDNSTTINGIQFIPMYSCDMFSLQNEYLISEQITEFDIVDLTTYLGTFDLSHLSAVSTHRAEYIYDEYLIRRNIIKMKYNDDKIFWLELVYTGTSVLFTVLNLDDIVSINDRNIASTESIVPSIEISNDPFKPVRNPMQKVYDRDDILPVGFYNQFPLIYMKQNGKYLINTAQTLDGLEVIPNFNLGLLPNENYFWAYTYDIYSTSVYGKDVKYSAPIFKLSDNSKVDIFSRLFYSSIGNLITNTIKKFIVSDPTSITLSTVDAYKKYLTLDNISTLFNAVSWSDEDKYFSTEDAKSTLILYVVPLTTTDTLNVFNDTKGETGLANILYYCFSNVQRYNDSGTEIYRGSIFTNSNNYVNVYDYIHSLRAKLIFTSCTLQEFLKILSDYSTTLGFYIKPFSDITEELFEGEGLYNCKQTAIYSNFISFAESPMNYNTLEDYLKTRNYSRIYIKPLYTSTTLNVRPLYEGVQINNVTVSLLDPRESKEQLKCLFPYREQTDSNGNKLYLTNLCTALIPGKHFTVNTEIPYSAPDETKLLFDTASILLYQSYHIYNEVYRMSYHTLYPNIYPYTFVTLEPGVFTEYTRAPELSVALNLEKEIYTDASLFNYDNNILKWKFNDNNGIMDYLKYHSFFEQGLTISFHILQHPTSEFLGNDTFTGTYDAVSREKLIASTSLKSSRTLVIHPDKPNTIVETLTEEPKDIREFTECLVFRDTLGDHLVTYGDNKVYMSEPNKYYYFTYNNVFEYPYKIIKVIQFKDTMLVFTTQHLYSIFSYEDTQTVQDGVDDEGNPKYVQKKTIVYNTLPVLYNLMINEKYKDAIQVFNQMVLFYSSDGQMFMIKPTASIDNNTKFSIQYFNKSVNDILLNYDQYINERLEEYNKAYINKDDVNIKVLVSLNYIKIFYNVPNVITYILIYDVVNNRYYTYDTVSFSNILDTFFTQENEVYITIKQNKLYFSFPYRMFGDTDVNVDKAVYYNFLREPIHCEIDSGTLALNNHLTKRFRTLRTIYKNLDATSLEFNVNTFVDDVLVHSSIDTTIDVKPLGQESAYELVPVETSNEVNLLEDNTALFNFSSFTSNKILTHKSAITSKGKALRVRLRFKSRGRYKFQGFGIVYKEHRL